MSKAKMQRKMRHHQMLATRYGVMASECPLTGDREHYMSVADQEWKMVADYKRRLTERTR